MSEQAVRLDISGITNIKILDLEMKLLLSIASCMRSDGTVQLRKEQLAKYFNKSQQTIGNKIAKLVQCNFFKYKYSGKFFINPTVLYKGSSEDFENTYKRYLDFKSDV